MESIQDEKLVKGVKYYLIRWKGYEADSDSWEPENTLNCDDIIKDFRASHSNGKSDTNKKKEKKKKSPSKPAAKEEENWNENEEFEVPTQATYC